MILYLISFFPVAIILLNLKTGILFISTLIFISNLCYSQKDTLISIPLDSIKVQSDRLNLFQNGIKIQKISEKSLQDFKHLNLSDLLALETGVYIKNYGGGNMATITLRGGNSNHTSILWNGFNINSSLNGGNNLNLIPVQFMDEINVQYGGSSSMWGSGSIGGSVHLNNNFKNENTISYNFILGSYGHQQHQIKSDFKIGKHKTYIKAFNLNSVNNYPYLYQNREIIQNHASIHNLGYLIGNQFTINQKQTVEIHIWHQYTFNEIPPILNQNISKAIQNDHNIRLNAQWKYQLKNKQFVLRSGYFNEKNGFTDSMANIFALNKSTQFLIENENNFYIHKNHQLQIGLQQSFINGFSQNFNGIVQQNKTSGFILYQFKSNNLKNKLSLSVRKEWVSNQINPLSFSANFERKILKYFTIYSNFNRVNRIPTFNDLFWIPGGKLNLLPEQGFTSELGLKWTIKLNKNTLYHLEINGYNKRINNWIIWLPNTNFWSPMNLMNVHSYGLESNHKIHWAKDNWKIQFNLNTNYNIAHNTTSKTPNDASLFKQLIYTPIYNFNGGLLIQYKKISVQYRQNYIGYTYTSSDHSNYLPPYSVGNLSFQYAKEYTKINTNYFFQITNIWNENYQVVQNRPMPLQQFYIGIQLSIKHLNFKK